MSNSRKMSDLISTICKLCDGRRVKGHYFLVEKLFQLLSADIIFMHYQGKDIRQRPGHWIDEAYNRIQRIQDPREGRQAHRQGHAETQLSELSLAR